MMSKELSVFDSILRRSIKRFLKMQEFCLACEKDCYYNLIRIEKASPIGEAYKQCMGSNPIKTAKFVL
jgi:hypothetical protein